MGKVADRINECRFCNSQNLTPTLNLGTISFTGVFSKSEFPVEKTPLILSRCSNCGLVQLQHNYDFSKMYSDSYGYESHLNPSMAKHLKDKASTLQERYFSYKGNSDLVFVDIASNDGTLLQGYDVHRNSNIKLVGIDPLISNFENYYPENSTKIEKFFSKDNFFEKSTKKANLVTSNSVLYDLENPRKFAQEVFDILDWNGIWHFEQSYLPDMIETLSYDTICQEHLLYLSARDINNLVEPLGFQIIEAERNKINGGSLAITAIKSNLKYEVSKNFVSLLEEEERTGIADGSAIKRFSHQVENHKAQILKTIQDFNNLGKKIYGIGASTKGNVLLQYAGLTNELLISIGDVNVKKFGRVTPGTEIPIVDEVEILGRNSFNDIVVLVLPWHFREGILKKCENLLNMGGIVVFPFPNIEIIQR